jgi:hypothetical protein
MSIDLSNNLESDGAVSAPLKSDGTPYRFCMYFDSSRSIVFSDNLEELISRLIPGYYRLATDGKLEARKSYLESIFPTLQTLLLQDYNLSDTDLDRALTTKGKLDESDLASDLPLIVVLEAPVEDYELALVYGDELEFLVSLDKVGYISLFRK